MNKGVGAHQKVISNCLKRKSRVIGKASPFGWRVNVSCRPGADIVPAPLHAKHDDAGVLAVGEVLLYGLVRAVGIANQDGAPAREKIVYPVTDRRVQSRNSS